MKKQLIHCHEWQKLQQHYQEIRHIRMHEWFLNDPQRFNSFSQEAAGVLLDYSKNRITAETVTLLVRLAEQMELAKQIDRLFTGRKVNETESQAALHTALRNLEDQPIYVEDQDIMPSIRTVSAKMGNLAELIRRGEWRGYAGLAIETIINVGIGGSDLGPALLYEALLAQDGNKIPCYFLSFFDIKVLEKTLANLNPHTTLVVLVSKSFTTQETLANAEYLKNWFLSATGSESVIQRHFFAVTARSERALALGLLPHHILPFWDWVGGRFSIWSAVGFSVAISLGMKVYTELLEGAYAMDCHFRTAPFTKNIPVILGLLDVWYRNFFEFASRAVIPYEPSLRLLLDYLQQLHMESLGKRVDLEGEELEYLTGLIIWGGLGTNSQHSFHQLLMQGKTVIPVDFILPLSDSELTQSTESSKQNSIANCLAQSQTLMEGYSMDQVLAQLQLKEAYPEQTLRTSVHHIIPGNCPSNTVVLSKINPYQLGALLALYEHKVFVCSVLWRINAFDQWGVERGKVLAQHIMQNWQASYSEPKKESSLFQWIYGRKHLEVI